MCGERALTTFAVELPGDDHAAALRILENTTEWHRPPGRQYDTAEVSDLSHPFLAGASRAFFIKMQPGTHVYRHRDPKEVTEHFDTDHIVVTTNDKSFICWQSKGDRKVHLDLGKRYRILDRGVLHWAVNDGETDRVHMLIEYPKQV